MLKFFRRIRKRLLAEGKLKNYLYYAIGEVLLVMIGILLALQVNNWNEHRKERIIEQRVLRDLVENLELNIQTLESQIAFNWSSDTSSELIISVIEGKQVYHDSLITHFGWALNIDDSGTLLSSVGYESLKNIGIEIIQNKELKKEVIYLFEETYHVSQARMQRIGNLYVETVKLQQQHFLRQPGFRFAPFDIESLVNDQYFNSWLLTIRENRAWITVSLEDSLEETQRILQLIEDELN